MLKQRVITAGFMAVVFFTVLFVLPKTGFVIFITLVLLTGFWEWSNLAGLVQYWQRFIYCLLGVSLAALVASYTQIFQTLHNETHIRNLMILSATWWAVALLWIQGYPSSAILWRSCWVRAVVGFLVLIPSWLALLYLNQLHSGSLMIVLVMVTVFVADTGAYFSGKNFGKYKLAVAVSPGKTLEGFVGGLVCCSILALLVALVTDISRWLPISLVLLFTALASVLGDLLESMFKRERGIKDSGVLLPGHGGVLDRLDSISAATPIFVLLLMLTGWKL